ncbi:hypothetical protein ACQJBY_023771 [Aegilops geniculata]
MGRPNRCRTPAPSPATTNPHSSSSAPDEILLLIPRPDYGDRVISFVSVSGRDPGSRFYKCVRKEAGMCGFLRSTDTYWKQLAQLSLGHQLQQSSPASTAPASFLHRLVRRDQSFKEAGRTLAPDQHVRLHTQIPQGRPVFGN